MNAQKSRKNEYITSSCKSKQFYDDLTWCGSNCSGKIILLRRCLRSNFDLLRYRLFSDHKLKTTEISTWIEVTVTANNKTSAEIFGDCIDAIDNLIQEWYPALTENFFPIIFYFAAYFIQEHLGLSWN